MRNKKLSILVGTLLSISSGVTSASSEASLGFKQSELNGIEHQVLFAEYQYHVNDYLSFSVHGGTGATDEVTASLDDTYVADLGSDSVVTDTYEQTSKVRYEAGLSLNAKYPVINGWSVYGRLGYIMMQTEDVEYNDFFSVGDTPPADDPESAFLSGSDLCNSTGLEAQCGVSLDATQVTNDYDMGYTEVGLTWQMSETATLSFGRLDTISSGDSYDAFILRLGLGFW